MLSGCHDAAQRAVRWPFTNVSRVLVSGTEIHVALGNFLSSRTAKVGDPWKGTVTENVMSLEEDLIPPGSEVEGVVAEVVPAGAESRALLRLAILGIRINGRDEAITARSDAVVSGSTRERELGDAVCVAQYRDHEVVLTDDAVMTFSVSRTLAIR